MDYIFHTLRHPINKFRRHTRCFANGLRFGFLYLRARWFRIPHAIRVAGRRVTLRYPLERGVETDFVACIIRNDYGLRQRLGDIRTIIDVGANVGFFSIAARGHYPHAVIHAYEPNARVLPFLISNTSGLDTRVYPEAIGSCDGFVNIIDAGPSNLARTQVSNQSGITMVGLNRAIQRVGGEVDLLKLDCEGAEWDLFQLAECWKQVRNLRMEYHLFEGQTFSQLEESLHKHGFTVIHTEHDIGFGIVWATKLQHPL